MAADMSDRYKKLTNYIIDGQQQFYRVAYTHVGEREAALDVVQNAICKALENYGSLRNEGAMKTWFYRILINECWNYLRKLKREIVFEPAEFPQEIYEEPAFREELDLFTEVANLPEQVKTVIILHYFENLTLKEIAASTGMNLNTVKTRLYSGLRKLRVMIQEKEKCL